MEGWQVEEIRMPPVQLWSAPRPSHRPTVNHHLRLLRRNSRSSHRAVGFAMQHFFSGQQWLVWLKTAANGNVERCHLRDPSWFQWPVLEAAIEGNIVADFPLCNKSFNCSYSGHDL